MKQTGKMPLVNTIKYDPYWYVEANRWFVGQCAYQEGYGAAHYPVPALADTNMALALTFFDREWKGQVAWDELWHGADDRVPLPIRCTI